ncbi:hypothetical protein LCGC14_0827850 [marine sediment metagenome]|uniref:Uncharacterized protein n=1 Tax=marine sediment metagenome TaxID=412755 RepID=A0A0F9PGT1_9ZZZZ
MRFHELLRKVTWEDVESALRLHYYPGEIEPSEGYRVAWDQLFTLEPTEQTDQLHVDPIEDEDREEELPVDCRPADVYCREADAGADDHYAVDFMRWADVLGTEIAESAHYGAAELAAHILWEMTWHGFDEAEVLAKWADILRRTEEIKNQTAGERAEQQRRSDEFWREHFPDSAKKA